MAKDSISSWQAPPMGASESRKIGWLNEHAEDGLAFQKSQRGYGDWASAFDILSGRSDGNKLIPYRSQLSTARLKRNLKEVRGAICDIRPIWAYSGPSFIGKQATMMNEITQAIYLEQFLDLSIKKVFDWAATTNTGWAHPVWTRDRAGTGRGNLEIRAFSSASILFSQMPADGNSQNAYAVSLLEEMPIYMAHGLFPKFQDKLHPTQSKFWYSAEIRTASTGNMFRRIWNSMRGGADNVMSDAYIPVRKTWVNDLSINDTGETMYLGDWKSDKGGNFIPTSSWSYKVPALDSEMEDGRIADENDARLFPSRRLIISSETCCMYDGPAFDWHGELPLIPLTLDDWAFEPMGFSLIKDGYEIQKSLNELERGTMDKNRAQMDMSLAYDINSVSSNEAKQYDPMQPRGRVGFDGSLVDEPFKSVVPDAVLRVSPEIFTAIEHLENTMDYQMGIKDIAALARARGLAGSEDLVEKISQANGPIMMEITRNIERFLSGIGNQTKYIIPQYMTTSRVMSYVGPDKVTRHTWDYDPQRIIPSHLPHEDPHDSETQKPITSKYSMMQRARWFCDNLKFVITPHTAHELVQMAYKLGLVQLRKAGIQISSRTIAEAWNIPNFGGPDGDTEYERYYKEQEDVAAHAIRIKQLVDAIQTAGVEPTPAMATALSMLMGQNSKEGRPTTGMQSPRIVSKDGGARSTISQSGS